MYLSIYIAVTICAALINTETHRQKASYWPVILWAQPDSWGKKYL